LHIGQGDVELLSLPPRTIGSSAKNRSIRQPRQWSEKGIALTDHHVVWRTDTRPCMSESEYQTARPKQ
jgi:hypothetical protein